MAVLVGLLNGYNRPVSTAPPEGTNSRIKTL
jgi:transposase